MTTDLERHKTLGLTETHIYKIQTHAQHYFELGGPVLWDDANKEYKFYDGLGNLIMNVREAMIEAVYFKTKKGE